ncbi:deoxyribose-phosphate aldolase [Clostridiales bacterium COT073_COT-073]|nr:deoxyribose-phosphate aldolase [Clostridiales bacterium COT073_COT-073]
MKLEKYIDHTLLKPDATKAEIVKVCSEAKEYNFASVCVNEYYTGLVAKELAGSEVKVCTVVGFPLGASTTEVKVAETKSAIAAGAQEIDMVINIGALKDKEDAYVTEDIRQVKAAAGDKVLKVIIETCLLTEEEKVRACELSVKAGADFVKTSTGFSKGGSTPEDVALMKKTVNGKALVKASGGVRSYEDAMAVIKAGADRIGASAGIAIIKGEQANTDY